MILSNMLRGGAPLICWVVLGYFAVRVHCVTECCPFEYRAYNGTGNNVNNPSWGTAGAVRIRSKTTADYTDGTDTPDDTDRPSAREVLNQLFLVAPSLLNDFAADPLFSAWGMVVAYDMMSSSTNSSEALDIACDVADYFWCSTATSTISFSRSAYGYPDNSTARAPINYATAYLDASIIYGNDEATANSLRTFSGGKLNMTSDDLPYLNSDGETWQMAASISFSNSPHFFAMLVVLMREHNRRCDELAALSDYSDYDDETMFQAARMWVYSVIQHITRNEFALKVLGSTYESFFGQTSEGVYNSSADAGIDVFFSSAAFRFAHSGVGNTVRLLDYDFSPIDGDPVMLSDLDAAGLATLVQEKGIDPILLGGMLETNQEIDGSFSTSIALSPLFTVPTFTVQRGRDHGLPTYNDAREAYGLAAKASFSDITSDTTVSALLESLYSSIDVLDAYVGGICEDHASGAMVGELFQWSIADQLYRMETGDRLWHQHTNPLQAANSTTLDEVIIRNTGISSTSSDVMTALDYVDSQNCSSTNTNSVTLASSYVLTWVLGSSDMEITVAAQNVGSDAMIGLGFGTSVMSGSDMVVCVVYNSTYATCSDRYGVGSHEEPELDSSGDLYYPVSAVSVDSSTGWTSVTYTRPLAGNDDSDYTITSDDLDIIFSWATGGFGQHASSDSGSATINFYTGSATVTTDTASQAFFTLHGAYMLAAWLVAVPAGWLVARYGRGRRVFDKEWYEIHAFFMGFAAQGSIALAVCGYTTATSTVSQTHSILGGIVLVYTLLQLGSGYMRFTALTGKADNFNKIHSVNRRVHKWSGRVLVVIAITNCYYGLGMMSSKSTISLGTGSTTIFNVAIFGYIKDVYPIYLPLLGVLFIVLEVHRHHELGSIQDVHGWFKKSDSTLSAPLVGYTLDQFNDRVTRGRKAWVIINRKIINIQEFMNRHPGGRKLLIDHVGADVSKQFKGIGKEIILPTGMLKPHPHSARATKILKGLVVGRIVDDSKAGDTSSLGDIDGSQGLTKLSKGRDHAWARRGSEYHRCKLLSRRRAGGDDLRPVWVYTFTWPATMEPADEALELAHKGLSFLNLHIAFGREGAVVERPYNISEVCHVGPEETVAVPWAGLVVRFHVRLYPDGEMSAVLRDITEGSIAMLQGPFTMPEFKLNPPPHYKRMYLLAGGTGINPMVSLVREYIESTMDEVLGVPLVDYAITLLWQVTSPKDVYDLERLQALNKQSGGRFTYLVLTGKGEVKLGGAVEVADEVREPDTPPLNLGWRWRFWRRILPGSSVRSSSRHMDRSASVIELQHTVKSSVSMHPAEANDPKRRGSQEPLVEGWREGVPDMGALVSISTTEWAQRCADPSIDVSDHLIIPNTPTPALDLEAPIHPDVPMIPGRVTEELLAEVIGPTQLRRMGATSLKSRINSAATAIAGAARSRINSAGSGDEREQPVPQSPHRETKEPGSPPRFSLKASRHSSEGGPPELQRVASALEKATRAAQDVLPPRVLDKLNRADRRPTTVVAAEGAAVGPDELRVVVSGPSGFTEAMQKILTGMSLPENAFVLLD